MVLKLSLAMIRRFWANSMRMRGEFSSNLNILYLTKILTDAARASNRGQALRAWLPWR
jgi:hypothetical protein